jgi:type IV pilus assembly protein PilC
MPYYQWRGVNLQAATKKGRSFAQSDHHLAELLFKKDIALLEATERRPSWIGLRSITRDDRTTFFRQLATLVNAGVLLPDALTLIAQQVENPRLQHTVYAIADAISSGKSFSSQLALNPALSNHLILQLIQVGQESASLAEVCATIAAYLERENHVAKKVRKALMLPLITFICFLVVTVFIIATLIPRFETLFAQVKAPVSGLTKALFYLSSMITLHSMITSGIGLIIVGLLLYKLSRNNRYATLLSAALIRMPLFGSFFHYRFCSSFFGGLSTLTAHAIPLNESLAILANSETMQGFKREITALHKAVSSGVRLSDALSRSSSTLFNPHIIAMVAIGEEANTLPLMLNKVSGFYQELLDKKMETLTTLLQPILMLVLGIFVAIMVFALYTPLFNISLHITP